jgi:FKBP-type peptidyl-prolyl cis-trans isomerase SlyD
MVADDVVVSMDYILTVEGKTVDSSTGAEPIQFIQGKGQIVPGLEIALYGMAVGESKQVSVAPAEGYGDEDPQAIAEVPSKEFPSEIPLMQGVELQIKNSDGEVLQAYVEAVQGDMVRLNFNHPLAGKELLFDVTIAALRHPTPEELDHGHVHAHGGEGAH